MRLLLLAVLTFLPIFAQTHSLEFLNHNRSVVDAHNCYPDDGRWADRLDRALSVGYPVGIEQDLAWGVDPATGKGRPVVSHATKTNGTEPTLRAYFFEHVRPLVEKALAENKHSTWPLIVVHFDFKSNDTPLLEAVWNLLGEYENWITTAKKTADPSTLSPFDAKPLLVLTEDNDNQEEVFFRRVPVGGRLRLFGSAHTNAFKGASKAETAHLAVTLPPDRLLSERPSNYRRWWNNSWAVVEEGGQQNAGAWTVADEQRLRALVNHAHALGYWIRFYTLDGFDPAKGQGWGRGYNFGSPDTVLPRWKAAVEAGVDLIATDQYEELGAFARRTEAGSAAAAGKHHTH